MTDWPCWCCGALPFPRDNLTPWDEGFTPSANNQRYHCRVCECSVWSSDRSRMIPGGQRHYEETGDTSELLYFVNWCFSNNTPVPVWLKRAFEKTWGEARRNGVSLDTAFCYKPAVPGKRWERQKRKDAIWREFMDYVSELEAKGVGRSRDKIFSMAGEKFGMSASAAEKLFYETMNEYVDDGWIRDRFGL